MVKAWIKAFRLRTIPLAAAGILTATFVSAHHGSWNWKIALLCLLSAISVQILSNLANDLGDAQKGTDNDSRVGPQRAIQSGMITIAQMTNAVRIAIAITVLLMSATILLSFGLSFNWPMLVYILLMLASIWAAVNYTVGENAYGYQSLGDVFVFLFFGLVAVVGCAYLQMQTFHWSVLLPAIMLGCLSVGVLNLNNMRDIENDQTSNKITIAVRLGLSKAKQYHYAVVAIGLIAPLLYVWFNGSGSWMNWIFVLSYPLFMTQLFKIQKIKENVKLDPFLKQLALSTLLLVIFFGVSINL